MALPVGSVSAIQFFINQTDLLAPTTQELIAPFDGFIDELQCVCQAAITTGGDITVSINGVTVAGLICTFADAATKGTIVRDTPNQPDATRQFKKNDRIQIIPSAPFNTAGAVNGNLVIRDSATISA